MPHKVVADTCNNEKHRFARQKHNFIAAAWLKPLLTWLNAVVFDMNAKIETTVIALSPCLLDVSVGDVSFHVADERPVSEWHLPCIYQKIPNGFS